MSAATTAGFVTMGEIVKAVGLKGEVKLYPLLDFHAPLLGSEFLVWGDGSPVVVTRQRPVGSGCVALTVRGVDRREDAEALVGRELGFRRESYLAPGFPKPPTGLPFRFLGREVVTVAGCRVGEVDEVRLMGGRHMLVVPTDGAEILIPVVEPIVRPDQGLTGDVVIDPPEGLLDVHRP